MPSVIIRLLLGGLLCAGPYWYLAEVGVDISAALDVSNLEVAGVAMAQSIRAGIYLDHLLTIVLVALGATLLSGVYPAWSAGRIAPVESIRIV